MIEAAHLLLYSSDPVADRAFLRDVLGWPYVQDQSAEDGWLIFRLPPTELGVHPTEGASSVTLHLICEDIAATVPDLRNKGVEVTGEPQDAGYGIATTVRLPSGAEVGLYEPRHQVAYGLTRPTSGCGPA